MNLSSRRKLVSPSFCPHEGRPDADVLLKGREFSPNFPSVARHIYTQLLRIFAHLYHAHYPIFLHLSSEGHLNSLFAHFLTFGREFDLLEEKETRAPKEGWPFVVGDLMDVSRTTPPYIVDTDGSTAHGQSWTGLGVLEA